MSCISSVLKFSKNIRQISLSCAFNKIMTENEASSINKPHTIDRKYQWKHQAILMYMEPCYLNEKSTFSPKYNNDDMYFKFKKINFNLPWLQLHKYLPLLIGC